MIFSERFVNGGLPRDFWQSFPGTTWPQRHAAPVTPVQIHLTPLMAFSIWFTCRYSFLQSVVPSLPSHWSQVDLLDERTSISNRDLHNDNNWRSLSRFPHSWSFLVPIGAQFLNYSRCPLSGMHHTESLSIRTGVTGKRTTVVVLLPMF